MEKGIKASVVIPTYNRSKLALNAAKIIRSFHPDIQITIVDQQDSSSLDPILANELGVKLISIDTINTSLAKNRGVEESKGDIVFFFDDDIEITKNTIPSQLNEYADPNVVGTCGRVHNDNEVIPEDAFVDTGKINFLGTEFIQKFWSTKKQYIDFPYGCNMSFRKSTLLKAGMFDPGFPKIFEEVDLGVRISRRLGKIAFVPATLAYHHKAPSGGTRTNMEGKMRMIYYHYGRYMSKHVLFPFSLITLFLRTVTVIKKCSYAWKDLYRGYFRL